MLIRLIKCYILDKHEDCWILGQNNGKNFAMCPYCRRRVIQRKDGKWKLDKTKYENEVD